ncbi:hypothetical protein DNH61_14030 [Paenibacillus sambharensis]|uniref:Uncharacterized protein n=1 Tax=Paenibacillus sambharensis TaxID=1803190 RepID=A0A2W1LL66_9BACL|nr:hypothetical protein [Paenibacillus sambharensis]PZD95635.1 hypothetical protein DNH61_14030 [Paenibacillus sambharensis]
MVEAGNSPSGQQAAKDAKHEGRDDHFMDIDRMTNEGLGAGLVTVHNARIGDTTTDTMDESRE